MNLKNYRWVLFGTRSVSLLERALRNRGYLRAGLSRVVAISKDGLSQIYVDDTEWKSLERTRSLSLQRGDSDKLRRYTQQLIKARSPLEAFNKRKFFDSQSAKTLFWWYEKLTEAIIYTHFLDKQISSVPRFRKYINRVSELHENSKKMLDKIVEEFSKTQAKNVKQLWLLPQEIIRNEPIASVIVKQRRKAYFLYSTRSGIIFKQGEKAQKMIEKFEKSLNTGDETKRQREIAGRPASPGRVKGIASVILDWRRIREKRIQILITPMTDTRTIKYLKKMKAIVTDEGGLTSHAAIVSRELKIPCIVGTKIATKVLKDGDLVEVDANKGIVKKISK